LRRIAGQIDLTTDLSRLQNSFVDALDYGFAGPPKLARAEGCSRGSQLKEKEP
jgi:hypothetical protein